MSEHLKSIGLGIILSKMRFSVSVSKVHYGYGFRVEKYIQIDVQDSRIKAIIQLFCDENKLTLKYRVKKETDIQAWMDSIEAYEYFIDDDVGYQRMKWILDNPMPRANKNKSLDEFYDWVKKWDDYNLILRNDI
tara:strand:- start:7004 stop:7405 length:402 start_codon:yes stop_codon:yes gene_type:complete